MPCMTRIYKDNKVTVHWSAARTKGAIVKTVRRLSKNGHCVPPFGLRETLFGALPEGRPGRLSGVLGVETEGRPLAELFLAALLWFRRAPLAPPRLAWSARTSLSSPSSALPRPVPPCRSRGMSGFWIRQVPEHALHEKGSQRQGVDPLASSQERRALLVLLINRSSTAVVNRSLCSSIPGHAVHDKGWSAARNKERPSSRG